MGSVHESLGSDAEIWGQMLRFGADWAEFGVRSGDMGSFCESLGSDAEIWGQMLRFGVRL